MDRLPSGSVFVSPLAQFSMSPDKLCRSTLDGISAGAGGALLRDDSQVVSLHASKRYCSIGERPGALLTVVELAERR